MCVGGGGVGVTVHISSLNAFFYSLITNVNFEGQAFASLLSNDREHAYIRAQ